MSSKFTSSTTGPKATISKVLQKSTPQAKETKDIAKYPYAGKKSDHVLAGVATKPGRAMVKPTFVKDQFKS